MSKTKSVLDKVKNKKPLSDEDWTELYRLYDETLLIKDVDYRWKVLEKLVKKAGGEKEKKAWALCQVDVESWTTQAKEENNKEEDELTLWLVWTVAARLASKRRSMGMVPFPFYAPSDWS